MSMAEAPRCPIGTSGFGPQEVGLLPGFSDKLVDEMDGLVLDGNSGAEGRTD